MKPIHECLLYRVGQDKHTGPRYVYEHWWYVHPDDVPDLFAACTLMQIENYCMFEDLTRAHGYSVQFNWVAYKLYIKTGKPEAYKEWLDRMEVRQLENVKREAMGSLRKHLARPNSWE